MSYRVIDAESGEVRAELETMELAKQCADQLADEEGRDFDVYHVMLVYRTPTP